MEKQLSFNRGAQPLSSPQDWELLLDDFSSGELSSRSRWLSLPLLDLTLLSLSRRDFPSPLKSQLLLFLEQHLPSIPFASPPFPPLLSFLKSLLLTPDQLKDQFLITTTSLFICLLHFPNPDLQSLTELLLTIINRPNYGPDRQIRAIACESLRELEIAFPCLLSELLGHVWSLAQSERTHVAQSYLLLLASISRNIVIHGLLSSPFSILSTSTPLVPFSLPQSLLSISYNSNHTHSPPSDVNLKDIRRVLAFLLERPRELTPSAAAELMSALAEIAGSLEKWVPAISSNLKVNFSSLLSSHNLILTHSVLTLFHKFSDAFSDEDTRHVVRRLVRTSADMAQPLVFRLLSLHWLLGSVRLARQVSESHSIPGFYPLVFDPLALKAKKIDAMAIVASEREKRGEREKGELITLLEDCLVCVSSFKWLPPWSSETSVAFRAMHKFLVGFAPHATGIDTLGFGNLMESAIFTTIQDMLVNLAFDHSILVPVIATFIDRLLSCGVHQTVGEKLLQILDEKLLPKLEPGYSLSSYFPLFEKIALNQTVPPRGLLNLLTRQMVCLTNKYGSSNEIRSWSQGSKVLGICRVMMKNHYKSRIFIPLSNLLAFTCRSFPDLEIRDNARICLRMLACIPGNKLRNILSITGQSPVLSPSPHPSALIDMPSPCFSQDLQKSTGISSYIHLARLNPLLVKQSWSLSLPALTNRLSSITDLLDLERESAEKMICEKENLRVVDSKKGEILRILRTHFACIPDYRYVPGIKIKIPCILRFEPDQFTRFWGSEPTLYATKLTFTSESKYGKIPPLRIPFIFSEPAKSDLAIVPLDENYTKNENNKTNNYHASVVVELEPHDPTPGLVDVSIRANTANGQIISGSLKSLPIGIEDMFWKPIVPAGISDQSVPQYLSDLFGALWEACSNSVNTGREGFPLSGGRGAAVVNGTQSVKLLEVSGNFLVDMVERHLARFLVRVAGGPLVSAVKQNGIIRDVIWEEEYGTDLNASSDFDNDIGDSKNALVLYSQERETESESESGVNNTLEIDYNIGEGSGERGNVSSLVIKKNMGVFYVLIFLLPRYHLLFTMEVGNNSTLVRIRTDHWPCLAYVDEYLEALL